MTLSRRWGTPLTALASLVAAVVLAWAPASAVAAPGAPSPAPGVVKVQYLGGQTAIQKPPSGNVYCTANLKRCLDAPGVTITPDCFEGVGRANFTFNNPNSTGAPVDIAVTYGGATYNSTYVAAPGVTNPFRYTGFPPGTTVKIVVGWNYQHLTFVTVQFVACG